MREKEYKVGLLGRWGRLGGVGGGENVIKIYCVKKILKGKFKYVLDILKILYNCYYAHLQSKHQTEQEISFPHLTSGRELEAA